MAPKEPDQPLLAALRTPSFAQGAEPGQDMLSGPLGLRAGWGILLFFVVSILLFVIFFATLFRATGRMDAYRRDAQQTRQATEHAKAAHQPPPSLPQGPANLLLMETAETGAVLLAALGLSFLERRRFHAYGLNSRHLRDLAPGAAWGLVLISALVAFLRGLHLLVFDGRLVRGHVAVRYGAEWLAVFVLVGMFEEFLFRGYIQFTLMRGVLNLGARFSPKNAHKAAFWLAAVVFSLLFSLTHLANAGEDPVGLIMVFVAGMVFSYALWRTGSLWWGIGFHLTWDWGQSFLFGVPDSGTLSAGRLFATHAQGNPLLSGGPTGPEGSVYVIPVLLLAVLAIRLQPQGMQPPVEPESLPLSVSRSSSEAIP